MDKSSRKLVKGWNSSKEWVDKHTRDFPELDGLVDGVPVTNVSKAPIVGDPTLGDAVRQIPRDSVQQVPVFSAIINGTKHSRAAYFSSFILRDKVFNEDTFGKGILSLIQIGGEAALTRGFQMFMSSLGSIGDDFGSSMKWVHYKDFGVTRGIFDFSESTEFYVRTRISESRLERLIESVKKNPKSTWNLDALEELLSNGPDADPFEFEESPVRDQAKDSTFEDQYDIITKFGVGPYYDIQMFSPNVDKVLRSYKSRSKFGFPRLQGLVLDAAQLGPFGVSRARRASPIVNYANIFLQSTAKAQLTNADPPLLQKGVFSTPVRVKRSALWKTNDPNADARFVELSTTTIREFRSVLDYTSEKTLSTMGVGTIRGRRSASTYVNSDTARAEASEKDLAVAQVSSVLESTLRQHALSSLDLYLSEQVGTIDFIVDDECKDAINSLDERNFQPTPEMPEYVPTIGDDNILMINAEEFYDSITKMQVSVDLSLSKNELEAKERADLQDAATVSSQTTDPNDPEGMARKRAIEDKLYEKMVPELRLSDLPAPATPEGMM